jgi:Tfp pilus assembly protein FimT
MRNHWTERGPARHRPPRSRPNAGLTVLELIVTLGLLTIVTAIGVSSLAASLAALRLPLGARQLADDLYAARSTALLRNTPARITFTDTAYRIAFAAGEPADHGADLPPGIRIVERPRAGLLRFFPSGLADNGTVVLAASSGRRRTVVVNQRGRITVR